MIFVQGINSTIAFGLFVKLICIAPTTPFPFVFGCVNLTQFKMVSMRSEKPIRSPPRLRSFPNVVIDALKTCVRAVKYPKHGQPPHCRLDTGKYSSLGLLLHSSEPGCRGRSLDCCVQVQGHSEGSNLSERLSIRYLLNG